MELVQEYVITDNYNDDYIIKHYKDEGGWDVFQLFMGNNSSWTSPGTLIGSLMDTGDEIVIDFVDKQKLKKLDYPHAEYIKILLTFNNKSSHAPINYKVLTKKFTF